MKKIFFLTLMYCVIFDSKKVYSQTNDRSSNTFCYCTISDSNMKTTIEDYIMKNMSHNPKHKGLIVLKLSSTNYDSNEYKFYITEILFKSDLGGNKPKAYFYINGFTILIYGNTNMFKCVREKYKKFYNLISKEHLVNQFDKQGRMTAFVTFDPEILEVTIHHGSISSKKELSTQPDLKN